MKRKRFLKSLAMLIVPVVALAAVPFVLVGCGGGDEDPNTGVLNVSVIDFLFTAPISVAQQRGYFAAEGLTVNITRTTNTPYIAAHLLGGQADIAIGGSETSLTRNDIADRPIIFGGLTRRDSGVILGRENVQITSRAHMAERMSETHMPLISPGLAPALVLRYALSAEGVDMVTTGTPTADQIRITHYSSQPDKVAAWRADTTGGQNYSFIRLTEPTASVLAGETPNQGYVVGQMGNFTDDISFISMHALLSTVTTRQADLERFLRAVMRGVDFIQNTNVASDYYMTRLVNTLLPQHTLVAPTEDARRAAIRATMEKYMTIDGGGLWVSTPVLCQVALDRYQDMMIYTHFAMGGNAAGVGGIGFPGRISFTRVANTDAAQNVANARLNA